MIKDYFNEDQNILYDYLKKCLLNHSSDRSVFWAMDDLIEGYQHNYGDKYNSEIDEVFNIASRLDAELENDVIRQLLIDADNKFNGYIDYSFIFKSRR